MRKNSKLIKINDNGSSSVSNLNSIRIDNMDMKVIELLTFGFNNKQISNKLKVPLSTIQRRTRKLGERN